MGNDTHIRSFIKGLSWRVFATLTTIIIVYVFFGRLDLAIIAGVVETITKIILYFFHERIWNKISFGKRKVKPFNIWFTGLPMSGKTVIANALYEKLKEKEILIEKIDRLDIKDLVPEVGSSVKERNKHIERVGHLIKTLQKHSVSTIAVFSSPYDLSRQKVKQMTQNYVEVYVKKEVDIVTLKYSTNLSEDEKRLLDMYDTYEEPKNPTIVLYDDKTLDEMTNEIVKYIEKHFIKLY